jgi:hypothetical protein
VARNKSINRPVGGLNQDDEDRAIPLSDYRYATNVRNAVNRGEKAGTLANILGNLEITKYTMPYTSGTALPSGRNRCIGAFEDEKYSTVIYFIWNSQGKHSILRWYKNNTDSTNPYGEIQQIISYNFGWNRNTRITSASIVYGDENNGDLLYWIDPKPKKINLTKGNICTKKKSWNVVLPLGHAGTNYNFGVVVRDIVTGGNVATANVNVLGGLTIAQMMESLATQINTSLGSYVTATSCGCSMDIVEDAINKYNVIFTDGDWLVIPNNWYGISANLEARFFDRCKWQPLQVPIGTYGQDVNYVPNYVVEKAFQFRLRYIYDDIEYSAAGVISQVPLGNLNCDGTNNEAYNYIDINFNDADLLTSQTLTLLKKVEVWVLQYQDANWKRVVILEPCEFLDYVNGQMIAHYKFYNDINVDTIDSVTSSKLFDNIPLEAGAEVFSKNRIIDGDILEGYDAPDCIEAKAQMEFVELPNQQLVRVKGKIRILTWGLGDAETKPDKITGFTQWCFYNAFPSYQKYPFWESSNPSINYVLRRGGIFHDTTRTTNNFAFFGGGGFGRGAGFDFGIRAGMEDVYDQRIPEGGFPVYAAGTNYLTISKQKAIGLPSDGNGALDTSNDTNKDAIGSYYSTGADLYSEFELLVPANSTYVIRLASHWCSFGVDGIDKLEKGFMYDLSSGTNYQKTSTNVWCTLNQGGDLQRNKEITITVGTTDIDDIGTFLVADLAPPFDAVIGSTVNDPPAYYQYTNLWWQPVGGYLFAGQDASSTDVNAQNFNGESVEKTIVAYGNCGTTKIYDPSINAPTPPLASDSTTINTGWNESSITDHNGYWFGIAGATNYYIGNDPILGYNYFPIGAYQSKTGAPNNTYAIRTTNSLVGLGNLTQFYNKTVQQVNYGSGSFGYSNDTADLVYYPGFKHLIITTNVADARENSSTVIDGTVIDQATGNGVQGLSVVYQVGRSARSRQDGSFSIFCWSDMLTPNIGNFSAQYNTFAPTSNADRIVDYLILEGSFFCGITYPNGQLILATITPFDSAATGYNPSVHYVVADIFVNESNNPSIKAHKRGGNYTYGVRLSDDAGRLCSVVKAFEMYVPFITEDIGTYGIENFSSVVYPANTFRYGKPSIRWVLDSGTVFPDWATRFQWMRTDNSIYGRYLQWVANAVTYLSAVETSATPEIPTSFQNSDAVAIKISISNIVDYFSQNNDSTIGYTFEAGDRVRLIADRNLVNYSSANFPQITQNITDFKITSYDETTQSIIIKPNGFPLEIKSGTLLEIFNAKSVSTSDEQIYYEVGEVVPINNGIPQSFAGVFTNGDTYWHGRNIPVNDDLTNFAAIYPVVIESSSISDFYPSEMNDDGRVGIVDPNFKQQRNPTLMRFTNQYLAINNNINGLSSIETENYLELDRAYGAIRALVFTQNTLVVVGANREVSQYLGQTTIQAGNTIDAGIVALSNSFFGAPYVHSRMLGTDNKASVVAYNGQIFGLANYIGNVWRYQGDGETCISDVKMLNYFQQLSNDGVSEAIAVFDRYNEEYNLTVWRKYNNVSTVVSSGTLPGGGFSLGIFFESTPYPELQSLVELQAYINGAWITTTGLVTSVNSYQDGYIVNVSVANDGTKYAIGTPTRLTYSLPETIVWFNGTDAVKGDKWISFRNYTPEEYCSLGSDVVAFKDGKLWIQGKNPIRNNFFGVQYTSKLNIVSNQEPDSTKNWYALYVENEQETGFNWSIPVVRNNNKQNSRILNNIFEKREEFFFAEFKRDLNTSGVTNPIIEGRQLRSSSIELQMENNSTEEFVLRNIVCEFDNSARE